MSLRNCAKSPRSPVFEQKRDMPYELPSQRLGPQLASEITHLFDEAQIPSFAWDWIEKSPLTEARNHLEFEFVIPDHLLVKAHRALKTVGFRPCPAESACHKFVEFPFKALPTAHFHHIRHVDEVVSLRKQSAFAAKLQLTLDSPAPNDPDFMLSNDPGLGGGPATFAPLPHGMYPFRLLTPVRFAEALMLQACRDVDVERETVIRGYMVRLIFLKQQGEGPRGRLAEEDFHEYLRSFWTALEEGELPLMMAHARRLQIQLNKTAFLLPTADKVEKKNAKTK